MAPWSADEDRDHVWGHVGKREHTGSVCVFSWVSASEALDGSQGLSPSASPHASRLPQGGDEWGCTASLSPDAVCRIAVAGRPGFCLHFNSDVVLFIAIYGQEFCRPTKHGSVVFVPGSCNLKSFLCQDQAEVPSSESPVIAGGEGCFPRLSRHAAEQGR